MTIDFGLAFFGLCLAFAAAVIGKALLGASANVAEGAIRVSRTLAREMRFRSKAQVGIVRARPPKQTKEDVRATPFDAWAGKQRGIDRAALRHLRGCYLLLDGAKGPADGERRESARMALETWGAPIPARAE